MDSKLQIELGELTLEMMQTGLSENKMDRFYEILGQHPDGVHCYLEFIETYAMLQNQGLLDVNNLELMNREDLLREVLEIQELQNKGVIQEENRKRKEKIKKHAEEELEAFLASQKMMSGKKKRDQLDGYKPSRQVDKKTIVTRLAACVVFSLGLLSLLYISYSSDVAKVVNSYNAEWESPLRQTNNEIVLQEKSYHLKKGYAEIEFYDGAKVILEGPVEIELSSANGAFLKQGKLSASVPSGVEGFTIYTPSADMVDLGTEFRVQVGTDGSSDLYVASGLVSLITQHGDAHAVHTGDAKSVSADGRLVKSIDFNSQKFITTFSQLEHENLRHPCAYEKIISSTRPEYHCRFESNQSDDLDMKRQIELIEHGPEICDDQRNVAATFKEGNYALMEEVWEGESEFSSSVLFWLRIDNIVNGHTFMSFSSATSPGAYESAMILSYTETKVLLLDFICHSPERENREQGFTGKTILEKGRWYHVAITVNQSEKVKLYLDGQIENSWKANDGTTILDSWKNLYLNNNGELVLIDDVDVNSAISYDELLIYDRMLRDDEIQKIYHQYKTTN